jgi:NADPH:quinone reductase-like Zn-dependent oxidoreductase
VSIRAASLGPWDLGAADGAFTAAGGSGDFPQIQGWDLAGETADGRRVLGFVAQPWMGVGAFAEQIAVPGAILAPLPEELGFVEGSTLPVCTLTAQLLAEGASVKRGDLVLVSGAAGMVGGFAAQLAVGRGARVVAAVRDSDAEEARRLGAETVVGTDELESSHRRGGWPGSAGAAGSRTCRDAGRRTPEPAGCARG